MQSYTTISVKPRTKVKIKVLKNDNETYGEYLEELLPELTEEQQERVEKILAD